MSAISQGSKFSFGGFFKQLFRRAPVLTAAAGAPAVTPATPIFATAAATNGKANSQASPKASGQTTGPGVTLSLQSVLAAFPLELRPKIRQTETGDLTLTVPLERILSQLSSGVVKVAFGDIRRSAPQIFAPGLESDAAQVCLPLNEVLARINPALLVRRPTQKKQAPLPDEISSPFAGNGRGPSLGVGNAKPSPVAPPPGARAAVTPQAPPRPPLAPVADETTVFHRKPVLPVQPPVKEPAILCNPPLPAAPSSSNLTPRPSGPSAAPVPTEDTETFQRKAGPSTPSTSSGAQIAFKPARTEGAAIFVRKPVLDVGPSVPIAPQSPTSPPAGTERSNDFLAAPPVARAVQPARPDPVTSPAVEAAVLLAPLAAFAEAWPEVVRQEIVQLNLVNGRLALPADLVESSLKRGRVVFSWKQLRSWIRPALTTGGSAHGAIDLEMPLNILAPLFMARQKAAGKQQRMAVDETIPNLFFGLPKPEPAHTPKPADTNYYTWAETTDQPRVEESSFKHNGPSGTDFVAKYATPNEIVSRAAALDGVAGVLIALPDGLMVASRIPPEHNGDTLAAFLPQIFSKVSQCTKELRMGDLNNLNFTVGNVPWKIFRVNAIFFAAFGRAGEQMPTGELVALAAELDRRR